jgi:hypothetical protein
MMAAKKKASRRTRGKTLNQPLLNQVKAELAALHEARKKLDLRLRVLSKNVKKIVAHHFTH